MDSRLVTQVENMATTSNLEDLEVDLNGITSNTHYEWYFAEVFASLPYFLHLSLSRYVDFKYAYAVK